MRTTPEGNEDSKPDKILPPINFAELNRLAVCIALILRIKNIVLLHVCN